MKQLSLEISTDLQNKNWSLLNLNAKTLNANMLTNTKRLYNMSMIVNISYKLVPKDVNMVFIWMTLIITARCNAPIQNSFALIVMKQFIHMND